MWCRNDRTSENLSACLPIRGSSSHSSIPGTQVFAGRNSPRNSAGASGFMSSVSMVDSPPWRNTKISETSFVASAARSSSGSPRAEPNRAAVPTRRASRRVTPSQKGSMRNLNQPEAEFRQDNRMDEIV